MLRRLQKENVDDVKNNGDWWKIEARIIRRLQASYGARGLSAITAVVAHALPGQVHLLFGLARAV